MKLAVPFIQAEREIITRRTLNFRRSLVYSAFSNPDRLKKWWGPKGFTNTFNEFDFRPGGRWKFVMHGPDKGNYNNECEFIQIEEPELIYWKRLSQPFFLVAFTFEEITDTSTDATFRMIFETKEDRDKLKKYVVDKNEENFDRLEAELQKMK